MGFCLPSLPSLTGGAEERGGEIRSNRYKPVSPSHGNPLANLTVGPLPFRQGAHCRNSPHGACGDKNATTFMKKPNLKR